MKNYQKGKIITDNSNLKIPYETKERTIKKGQLTITKINKVLKGNFNRPWTLPLRTLDYSRLKSFLQMGVPLLLPYT